MPSLKGKLEPNKLTALLGKAMKKKTKTYADFFDEPEAPKISAEKEKIIMKKHLKYIALL